MFTVQLTSANYGVTLQMKTVPRMGEFITINLGTNFEQIYEVVYVYHIVDDKKCDMVIRVKPQ